MVHAIVGWLKITSINATARIVAGTTHGVQKQRLSVDVEVFESRNQEAEGFQAPFSVRKSRGLNLHLLPCRDIYCSALCS